MGRPFVEGRHTAYVEAFQKVTAKQRDGARAVVRRGTFKLQRVYGEPQIVQRDKVAFGQDAVDPQAGPQSANCLIKRMSGCLLILLWPEKTEQVLASARAVGGQGEVNQQGEVLAPEHLRVQRALGNARRRRP